LRFSWFSTGPATAITGVKPGREKQMFFRYIISMTVLVIGIVVGVVLVVSGSVWLGWSVIIAVSVLVVLFGSLNVFLSNY
jgi:hypothetical protein